MPAAAAAPEQARWDVPIQERNKTLLDQPTPEMAPPAAVPQASAADTQGRWDVPIQERVKTEDTVQPIAPQGAPQAPPQALPMNIGMPPGALGASGIPVNQIVEKMGQVLGGPVPGASISAQESRWDVPIQERMKAGQASQENVPVQPAQAPAPAASGWGSPAPANFEAPAQAAPAQSNDAWGAPAPAAANNSSWDAAPPLAPGNGAGAGHGSGWGSGDGVAAPPAQPTSSWGQPATSGWDRKLRPIPFNLVPLRLIPLKLPPQADGVNRHRRPLIAGAHRKQPKYLHRHRYHALKLPTRSRAADCSPASMTKPSIASLVKLASRNLSATLL